MSNIIKKVTNFDPNKFDLLDFEIEWYNNYLQNTA
jgi:hypothetical protein